MKKNTELNTHIEYDDFGEYEEVLEQGGFSGSGCSQSAICDTISCLVL